MAAFLTDEQRRKMEENRQKALALRASRQQTVSQSTSSSVSMKPVCQQFKSACIVPCSTVKPSSSGYPATSCMARKSAPCSSPTIAKPFQRLLSEQSNVDCISAKAFSGKNISVSCFLVSRQRFGADAQYCAPLVEIFKSFTTRQYDAKIKFWSFELREYYAFEKRLKQLGSCVTFTPLPTFILRAFSRQLKGSCVQSAVAQANLSRIDSKLTSSLLTFQREGVNFAISNKGRVLIADDMGLGKTLQALAVACYYQTEWPLLIVAPSSVRFAWREQILQWLPSIDPEEINVVTSGKEGCTSGLINIVSYDLMVRCHNELEEKDFQVIIMDESHFLKNNKSARTKKALPLLKKASRVILLSGTPAMSRPSELFTQLAAVDPGTFRSFHEFGVRYCDAKKQPWGWDYSGSSNLAELQYVIEDHIMIRRLKKDVLQQLPSKYRTMIILDPCSVKVDKKMKTSHTRVGEMTGSERKSALLEYFHSSGTAKIKAVIDYVLDLLEAERKFLLFAHHQEMLDAVQEAVKEHKYGLIRIDGRTTAEQRNLYCNRFQCDEDIRIAVLSITAANAGLNLTAASFVIFAELFWNPGILVQAEDRAHRIGQMDSVNVQYLVARNTADDYIWPLIQHKLDILSKAGLSKDDFCETETRVLKDKKQSEILKYFEESFIEDDCTSTVGESHDASKQILSEQESVCQPQQMDSDLHDDDDNDKSFPEELDPDAPFPKKPKL